MRKSIEQLKQDFLEADKEYQFATASGNPARLVAALKNHRTTFDALNKAKKQEFKKKEAQAQKLS